MLLPRMERESMVIISREIMLSLLVVVYLEKEKGKLNNRKKNEIG